MRCTDVVKFLKIERITLKRYCEKGLIKYTIGPDGHRDYDEESVIAAKKYAVKYRKRKRGRPKKEKSYDHRWKKRRKTRCDKKKRDYHKKKRGPHFKRGPKRKKKVVIRKPRPRKKKKIVRKVAPRYIIYTTRNHVRQKMLGIYYSLEDAHAAWNDLKKKNKEVKFPLLYRNWGLAHSNGEFKKVNIEYLLFKVGHKSKDTPLKSVTMLKNEFGVYVPNIVWNLRKTRHYKYFEILDKMPRIEEETVWVYGYHPKKDRKTYQWVWENIIKTLPDGKFCTNRIYIFRHRLIIENDTGDITFITLKKQSEAIRFYNVLEKDCTDNKMKQIFFTGVIERNSYRSKTLVDKLVDLTGWDKYRFSRYST